MPDSFNITFQIQNHQLYLVSYHGKYDIFNKFAQKVFINAFVQFEHLPLFAHIK